MTKTSDVLDIGCGPYCLPGAVGIDMKPNKDVSVVHNMNIEPWPLPDNQFKKMRCQHVIEHIRDLEVLTREIYRLAKPGAIVDFITPHYSSYASWGDYTHIHHFALGSIPQLFEMVLGVGKFKVIKRELKFTGSGLDLFGWLIYKCSKKKYEKHFAWIFPANEIHVSIEIVK
jgi:hypothetical protein